MSDIPVGTSVDPSINVTVPGEGAEAPTAPEAPAGPKTREQAIQGLLAGLRLSGTSSELQAIADFLADPGE